MLLFSFQVPGEVNRRFIEASSETEAEKQAEEACKGHSFCGGAVRPPVQLVGEILPNRKVKLPSGRVVEDNF